MYWSGDGEGNNTSKRAIRSAVDSDKAEKGLLDGEGDCALGDGGWRDGDGR
jgi:hypothetical protein